jgi:rubredoxin
LRLSRVATCLDIAWAILVASCGRAEKGSAALSPIVKEILMTKWRCTVCDYVYDPAQGDPANGVAAGTAWEDVPEDWVCPVCSVGKDLFEEVSE